MKILMLGWELPPHNSGGLGVACYHMARALSIAGVSIDFVVPYSAKHPTVDFMTVHAATPLSPSYRYGGMGAYDSKNFGSGLTMLTEEIPNEPTDIRSIQKRYVRFVEQLVPGKTYDAIHAHDWLTMEAGMKAKAITGAPLIVHVHATEFDRSGELYGNPVVHEIEEQGLLMADRIIAVSRITKALLVQRYKIPSDKIEVVYNALDINGLPEYEYDKRTYHYLETLKAEGNTIVGCLTRLTVQKGLTQFLRAAARASSKNPKIAFLLAGDGEQRDELISLASELGIGDKVFFTGFVRGKQWRDAYNVLDVFVMSSVSEPFGLTALEAAHHDNALIISKQSGVGEVLSHILRFDFWDIDRLADQIVGIASSKTLKQTLASDVKFEYTRLSWHDVAAQCITQYKRSAIGIAA